MHGNGIDAGGPSGVALRRRVVVTGAGGFVGRHLVPALAAAGHDVVAVSRAPRRWPAGIAPATHPGIPVRGAAAPDWHAILAGADAVVHLAGLAHLPVDTPAARRALWRTNVVATSGLARAAAAAGIRDFVFVSSIKAVGDRSDPGRPLDESSPPHPGDCYGAAKRAAERRLERLAAAHPAMRVTSLRPPLMYGAGVAANFAALARLAARGWPLPLGALANQRSLLYVGNFADAIRTVLATPEAPGGTYHVCDGAPVSTPALVRALAVAQDRPARLVSLPPALLAGLATLLGQRARWSRLADSLASSDARFRRTFGWSPPFSLAAGLAAMFGPGGGR